MTDPTPADRPTGTFTVKRGLAEMLRGGVIMDVVDAEQAKVAEDAGAVAVMALERVPADIRRDGGVARMSDPALIEGIKAAVTVPVMAKARIGHFAEAQVLAALGVDFIDESEVLTPADEAHHIDKWTFEVPFVCGATNLGEALRRISEGAAMIRSKGEAGTGNIVEAVRHLRAILGDIRRITQADSAEHYGWAKELAAPIGLLQEIATTGRLPVPLFCAGGIATPADASLVMQLGAEAVFVGSGIFKARPVPHGPGRGRGHRPLHRRRPGGQGVHRLRGCHGRPGDRDPRRAPGRPWLVVRSAAGTITAPIVAVEVIPVRRGPWCVDLCSRRRAGAATGRRAWIHRGGELPMRTPAGSGGLVHRSADRGTGPVGRSGRSSDRPAAQGGTTSPRWRRPAAPSTRSP